MPDFSVAAAQFAPIKGDVVANSDIHLAMIKQAHTAGVQAIVFPELSLTGYELELANELAFGERDARLRPFRDLAEKYAMTLCIGAPIKNHRGMPYIGLFILRPSGTITCYRKIHLTDTETKFCSPGWEEVCVPHGQEQLGMAICADLGKPEQAQKTADLGATIFLASVLAADEWYDKDAHRLTSFAQDHKFLCVMANYCGPSGPYIGNGQSAIWTQNAERLVQADTTTPTLVIAEKTDETWQGRSVTLQL